MLNYKGSQDITFRTDGDKELGPLEENDATLGDANLPITVFGMLSFAVGDLHVEERWGQLVLVFAYD